MCKFTPVPCPNQCKGNDQVIYVMQKDLDYHVNYECLNRQYECEYCGEKGTYADITQVHDNTCEKKKIPCTNTECTETSERGKMKWHLDNVCEYTIIPCKYKNIGCNVEIQRKALKAHEDEDSIHLHLAMNTVVKLIETETLRNEQSIVFKLIDYKEKKENNEEFTSPSFYTSPEGYHMAISVYVNGYGHGKGTHVSIFVEILKGKFDAKLTWPFTGNFKIELLNQLADKNHQVKEITFETEDNARVGDDWGYSAFIPHSDLSHNPSNNTQYLKEDTLYFRVSVKPEDRKPWLECTHI